MTAAFSDSEKTYFNYLEKVYLHARRELLARRYPERNEEQLCLNRFYFDGTKAAWNFGPGKEIAWWQHLDRFARQICTYIDKKTTFTEQFGLQSSVEVFASLYRNEAELPVIHEMNKILTHAMASWLGLSDMYNFLTCFHQNGVFRDDARGIRPTVEKSLLANGAYEEWMNRKPVTFMEIQFSLEQPARFIGKSPLINWQPPRMEGPNA